MSEHVGAGAGERGAALMLFTFAFTVTALLLAMAIDLGTAFHGRSQLSKAVDAGSLAAIKYTDKGEEAMKAIALSTADANLPPGHGVTYEISVDEPEPDVKRISLAAYSSTKTFFAKLAGRTSLEIAAYAEAKRHPADVTVILDLSYSLVAAGAYDDMKDAAKSFIEAFDQQVDRLGLVSYSTWAQEEYALQKDFVIGAQNAVDDLGYAYDTNIEEGLRAARDQLDNAPPRTQATKVAVLFTDGRPTCFRDDLKFDNANDGCGDGKPQYYDCVAVAYGSGSAYTGTYRWTDGRRIKGWNGSCVPYTAPNSTTGSQPKPLILPDGNATNGQNIRALAAVQAEEWANVMRQQGIVVAAIGLGNPSDPSQGPDEDFLKRLANYKGVVSSSQPKGEYVFSPSKDELEYTFAKLADMILMRLSR